MSRITDQPPAVLDRALVAHLHQLGPDVLAEFLAETVDHDDLQLQLPRYARFDPADPCRAGAVRYEGPRPLAEVAAEAVIKARLRRKARALYHRPPRLLVEVVIALAALLNDTGAAERVLDDILGIPDEILDSFDARDVPPAPIHLVSRSAP